LGSRPAGAAVGHRKRNCLKPALVRLEDRRLLSTFTVNSTADDGSTGTLRWAVEQANAATSPSAIEFELGTTPAKIILSQGQIELRNTANAVTVYDGPGQGPVTVTGNKASRVFQVDKGVTATISGLTITGGSGENGGGLYNFGRTTLDQCTITGNHARYTGGGLYNGLDGTVTLTNCTISGNSVPSRQGGGLANFYGTATLTNCTISGNSAYDGGGLFNYGGTEKLYDCTISGNSASVGSFGGGGGLANFGGTTTLTGTIVAGNTSNIGGGGLSGTYNLIGTGASGGLTTAGHNLLNVADPLLSPLGNYGGPTQTIALLPGSPAIGAGIAILGVTTDQRGEPLDSPNPDIGAFQSQGFTLTPVAGSTPQSTPVGTAFAHPLAVTLTAHDSSEPIAGGIITFTAPSQGASAILSATTVTIDASGAAQVNATANSIGGSYVVIASAGGSAAPANFVLTNVAQPVFSALAGPTIAYGTPSVTLSGTILAGSTAPPGSVSITVGGVTQPAAIQADGNFSCVFNTASLGVAGSPYTITYAYAATVGFLAATDTSQALTVAAATPVLTWPNPADITYGTALGSTQLDAATNVAGTFTYTPAAGTILPVGLGQTLSVSFTPTDTVDYKTATATATINVVPATPTITWPDPASIVYGTALSSNQLDATASVPGTFTYTPAAGTVLGAGTNQALGVSFTPTDTTDYTTASYTAHINVDKAQPSFSQLTASQSITYGQATINLSGQLAAPTAIPTGEQVSIVIGLASGKATVQSDGSFSTTISTNALSASSTPYTIGYRYTGDANFQSANDSSTTLTINKATPTITWSNPASIVYGTALSSTQLDATASVSGTFTYNPPAGTILAAGSNQLLTVSLTPADSTNYTTASTAAHIDVSMAQPIFSQLTASQSIAFGQPTNVSGKLAATTAIPTGEQVSIVIGSASVTATIQSGGSFSATIDTNAQGASSTPYTITYSYTGDANFQSASDATTTLTVNKATPTLTWPNPTDITYGTPLSGTQLDATASVAGTFTYTPAPGTVLKVGASQTLSVVFTPTDTIDYTGANTTAMINVAKAAPTITWSNPADIVYGTALSSTQLDASASASGSFTYTPLPGTVLKAGAGQTLSTTFTPTDTADYKSTSATAMINVLPATPVIAWPNPADIVYGTALGSTQLDATASVPGTFSYTPDAGAILHAGAGQILSVGFAPTDRTDYATVTATATISVSRATPVLTVSAPGGTYDGTPFPATVAIASGIPGFNNTPAASLEDITPILTYYVGVGISGPNLGAVPPTAAGAYTVVARFPGSTDYAAVTSAPITFTINRGTARIALTTSGDSAVYGQPITIVATVTGPGTPGGAVAFSDGATFLATVPLDGSGTARLTTSGLALGSHAITATYSGDANFLGVRSGPATEFVSQAATRIVLVPHPVLKRKSLKAVGLTAEIEPVAPGGGIPTGLVTFEFIQKHRKKIKIKTLGTTAVHAGAATLTLKPKQVLNKPLTIIYSGDPNYRASTLTPPKLTRKALKSLARSTATGQ
jgi:hypothetical protein